MARGAKEPVGAFGDGGSQLGFLVGEDKLPVVKPIKKVAAHVQFFQELGICRGGNVHVAVVALVALGVVLHGLLERAGNADVVHYQAALFAPADAVHASDCLHQVVTLHGLEHIHGG